MDNETPVEGVAGVWVRARTSDNRWASVNALDLDERSFRILVLSRLNQAGLLVGLRGEWPELRAPLTKAQAEGEENGPFA